MGGADIIDELLDHLEEFLKMYLEAGIKLNPAKIRIGFEKEQFFGLNGEDHPSRTKPRPYTENDQA